MNIKVIIADDEPLLLKSIKISIESAHPSFHVVGQATDGKRALQLIAELQPDMVFVDIRMPIVDGLTMVETLRRQNNFVPVIILSGYKEFEYAKKAIQLEVTDYLLKPINPDILRELLTRFHTLFMQQMHVRQVEMLEAMLHNGQPAKTSVHQNLFNQDVKYISVFVCLGSYCIYRFNQFSSIHTVDSIIDLSGLKNVLLPGFEEYWVLQGQFSNEKILLFSCKNNAQTDIHTLGESIYSFFKKSIRDVCPITVFVGNFFSSITDFRTSMTDLEYQIKTHILFCQSSLQYGTDSNKPLPYDTNKIFDNWIILNNLFKKQKTDEILLIVKKILSECEQIKCPQVYLVEILEKLSATLQNNNSSDPHKDIIDIDFLISNSVSYKELYKNLTTAINNMIHLGTQLQIDHTTAHIVDNIEKYLSENFTNKIYLQEIAERFGFNYTYLSSIFKKYKNISPNEYIINKRIEKASQLFMSQPELTIKSISNIVGYDDPYYFSRIFKSVTGKSPSEFKGKR